MKPSEYKHGSCHYQNTVYLNGEYMPLADAKISVLDRGFLFADSVYEVIPSYGGKLFKLPEHIQRLSASLQAIRLDFACSSQSWHDILAPLLATGKNQSVYLQITRGVGPGRDHAFPKGITPTVFAMCSDITATDTSAGVSAISCEDNRWGMCQTKATSLLANVLLRQRAVELGAFDAILHREGYVTEGSSSNLFAVIDGVLLTPAKAPSILPGITRQVVLDLATQHGIANSETAITLAQLRSADEIILTSSIRELVPIVTLDDTPVGSGKVGAIFQHLRTLFAECKRAI